MCAKVWDLSNPGREPNFTQEMFFVAIHLMYTKKKDANLQLPDQVPIELKASAAGDEGSGSGPSGINTGVLDSPSL